MMSNWAAQVFLSQSQRRLFTCGLPVLVLHKIASPPVGTLDPFDYIRPKSLEAKLSALGRAGLRSVSLDTLGQGPGAWAGGFVVSFDDGYRNVWQNGLEILARHQVRAIQFLVAGRMGQRNEWDVAGGDVEEPLMDEPQVRDWLSAGHEIGSHGLTHRVLKKLGRRELQEEIQDSKKKLEDTFGVPVRHFSYPSGKYNPMILELVREGGYQTGSTVQFGVNSPGQSPFEVRRIAPLYGRELVAKAWHRLRRRFALWAVEGVA
jgi:peptidoglycan/xylan/chitin deacetylase (PgdA/CDA1 family)